MHTNICIFLCPLLWYIVYKHNNKNIATILLFKYMVGSRVYNILYKSQRKQEPMLCADYHINMLCRYVYQADSVVDDIHFYFFWYL